MASVRPSYRHVFAMLALVASLYFGVRTSNAVLADRSLAAQLGNAQGTVDAIKQQNAALSAQLVYQQTPAYAEQVAREQLGLMKPGDHVVHVQVAAAPETVAAVVPAAPAPSAPAAVVRPNWQRWLRLFTHPPTFASAPVPPKP
jgi:cell division protein FtsB